MKCIAGRQRRESRQPRLASCFGGRTGWEVSKFTGSIPVAPDKAVAEVSKIRNLQESLVVSNGVHFFHSSSSKSGPKMVGLCTF